MTNCMGLFETKGLRQINLCGASRSLKNNLGCHGRCRLQLLKFRRNTWFVQQEANRCSCFPLSRPPPVFFQFLWKMRMAIPLFLGVTIGPVSKPPQQEQSKNVLASDARGGENTRSNAPLAAGRSMFPRMKRGADPCMLPTDMECCLHADYGADMIGFSSSGSLLAMAFFCSNKTSSVILYDADTWKILHEIRPAHNGTINEIVWSKDD
uniref:Uncharacterized protein n=1 Tax=Trieres chinensis TaxID=1514140 RepID=A0A7S2E7X4_TRICV|mmetsp:Transcript_11492/g.23986  ORF Transcript_11492/g.23986 Transcript_11492/m.23986 type:complete len:209 (+) Transcript_11492:923-1549(+)